MLVMSKNNMLRTRRRDVNVKPNRRLDRKSSRGMLYENEELRLRTININAEIERGQTDIKKLRKENEQLRKEIWCLRDEYDKLDKLLKDKEDEDSSCTSDSESCSSCTESEENETTQNLENVQKTALNTFRKEFDHLSVVTEENSAENSDKNSIGPPVVDRWEAIQPDQSYPAQISARKHGDLQSNLVETISPQSKSPKHFFSPIRKDGAPTPPPGWTDDPFIPNWTKCETYMNYDQSVPLPNVDLLPCEKSSTDLLVADGINCQSTGTNSFINGGNLEELLQDIETLSKDILQISAEKPCQNDISAPKAPPYKSEINVVLLPKPMPLIGFDKYFKNSREHLPEEPTPLPDPNFFLPYREDPVIPRPVTPVPFRNVKLNQKDALANSPELAEKLQGYQPENSEIPARGFDNYAFKSDLQSSDEKTERTNEQNECIETGKLKDVKPVSRTRKVSIYFKGKKDKFIKNSDDTEEGSKSDKSPITEKKQVIADAKTPAEGAKTEDKTEGKSSDKKHRKSSSTSPERKHHGKTDDGKRVHKKRHKKRSIDRIRERSYSLSTDRSNILDHRYRSDDYTNSERERTNSLSSCDTLKSRKLSGVSTFHMTGKIPWFGCWGNGCI